MKSIACFKILLSVVFLLFFVQIVTGESTATTDVPNWNLIGPYTWNFVCTSGCTGMQLCSHTMIITSQEGGTFSGTGYTNTNPSLPWIASGTVSGSTFTLQIVYSVPPHGSDKYTATITGTISSEGKLSGSGLSSANERGNIVTTSGAATPLNGFTPRTSPVSSVMVTPVNPSVWKDQGSADSPVPDSNTTQKNGDSLLFMGIAIVGCAAIVLFLFFVAKRPSSAQIPTDPDKGGISKSGAPPKLYQNNSTGYSLPKTVGSNTEKTIFPSSGNVSSHHDVFISYSHEDKTVADAICASLESEHIRCWVAPRDVLPGENYPAAIINAIEKSRIMVLVYSSKSNSSDHVIRELTKAVSNGTIIIPFRIEDVPPSKDMEYLIGIPHWLDALTPPLEQHIEKLVQTIQLLLVKRQTE